jgi:hypothetical protein
MCNLMRIKLIYYLLLNIDYWLKIAAVASLLRNDNYFK